MANSNKTASKILTETPEQFTKEVELEELQSSREQLTEQSAPMSPEERANKAYKLVYGEDAEVPIEHKAINTAQGADWFIRSYMGGLFATPNDHPLTQNFSDLEELLEWFDDFYPAQVDDAVEQNAKDESVETESAA